MNALNNHENRCSYPNCIKEKVNRERCKDHKHIKYADWIEAECGQDLIDSPKYKRGLVEMAEYVELHKKVKYVDLYKKFQQFGSVLESMVRSLEIELKCSTVTEHITFVIPMPEDERKRRLMRRREVESGEYGYNAAQMVV